MGRHIMPYSVSTCCRQKISHYCFWGIKLLIASQNTWRKNSTPLSNLWQSLSCFPLHRKIVIIFNITYYRVNSISLSNIQWWNSSWISRCHETIPLSHLSDWMQPTQLTFYKYCWLVSFPWVTVLSLLFLLLLISLISLSSLKRPFWYWMWRGIISKPVLSYFWSTSNNYRSVDECYAGLDFHLPIFASLCFVLSPHNLHFILFISLFIIVPSYHRHLLWLAMVSYYINCHDFLCYC